MDIAIYSAVLLGGLAFIAYPLLARRARMPAGHSPAVEHRQHTLAEKEAVYAAINDLDFEYRTGKLSDDDYAELREGYRARALRILKELNERQREPSGAQRCPGCGYVNPRGSKFCESCGAKLDAELTCHKCGTGHEPADNFCAICGNPLR